MKNPTIIYYPAIGDQQDLLAQVARATWYLAPLEPASVRIFSPHQLDRCADLSAFTPEIAAQLGQPSSNINVEAGNPDPQDIASSDIVVCWRGLSELENAFGAPFVAKLRKSGTRIFDVDYSARTEGSRYIDLSHRLPANDASVAQASHEGFKQLASELSGYDRAFLLCSGPEVQRYEKFDLADGIGIVCNSVINDLALMEAVKPKIQIFGDPIFHFGCSRYAHEFRERLRSSAQTYQFTCIIPIKYYNLFVWWMPELADRTFAIPFDVNTKINLNLLDDFTLHTTDNILTFLMLPVAASLCKQVYLLGCDGRPLQDNTYFWQHNKKTQFVDQMDNIQRVHPSFFNLDYDEYYLRHCDTVDQYFQDGEAMGCSFYSLTPSFIPAIRQREHVLARVERGKTDVCAVVRPRPCPDPTSRGRHQASAAQFVLEAVSVSEVTGAGVTLPLFDNALTPGLGRAGEFEGVVDAMDSLADTLSLWKGRVEILQPCASVADVRALQASRSSGYPSRSLVAFAELGPADTEFLTGNKRFLGDAVDVTNLQLKENIAALCELEGPAAAGPAASDTSAWAPGSSMMDYGGATRTERERDWARSFLAVKEKQADLELEFELFRDSTRFVAGRVRELEEQLESMSRSLASKQSELEKLRAALDDRKNGWRNAADFQHFARHLEKKEAAHLAEVWGDRLGMELQPRSLSYLANKICTIESGCLGRLATDIKDAVIRALCLMSLQDEALDYLEIGTLFGINAVSAWEICSHQFEAAHITCIDPLEGYYGKGRPDTLTGIAVSRAVVEQNLRKAMIPESSVTLLQGLSEDIEILEQARRKRYNFVLIDGDHSYDGVRRDFENYAPLVKSAGLLVIDDYGSPEWPEIKKYADEHVLNDERFSVVGADSRTLVLRRR